MKRATLIVLMLLMTISVLPGHEAVSPYSQYERTTKNVTELDWRLLLINIRITNIGVQVSYNHKEGIFYALKVVHPSMVEGMPVENFLAEARAVRAWLETEFPEFEDRNGSDLLFEWKLGRDGIDEIAECRGEKFEFKEGYYKYLREVRVRQ